MKQFKDKVSILVLDYNKPEESRLCLESVQKHCKFEKEVVFYSNGGEQDYVMGLYKEGLIDKLVLSKKNWGLGIGTTDLLQLCRTEYFIYLQNDQFFFQGVTEEIIKYFIKLLKSDARIGCISLAGFPCGDGIYSDRCHFAKTDLFRAFDKWGEGYPDLGCGPFWNGPLGYNENFIQKAFKEFGMYSWASELLVQDNGRTSIRENPDGSIWSHRPSTKELWLIKGPVKERFGHPNLTDEEWSKVLETQKWDGDIPELELAHSFKVQGWD